VNRRLVPTAADRGLWRDQGAMSASRPAATKLYILHLVRGTVQEITLVVKHLTNQE
jgi:hypothetical protein